MKSLIKNISLKVKLKLAQRKVDKLALITEVKAITGDYFTYDNLRDLLALKGLYSKAFINEILNDENLIEEVGCDYFI
jgi:hypothetical protein